MRRAYAYLASLVCLKAAIASAQDVPTTTLTTPVAEHPEAFTNLMHLRELRDGRVLSVEQCERLVKLIDFNAGTVSNVGRTGSGPREYRTPARLLPMAGDSTALYDIGNRRYLVIRADGTPGDFFDALPTVTETRGNVTMATRAFNPMAADSRGRFYARESGVYPGASGMMRAESVAVHWWDPATGRRDTVAYYRLLGRPGPITPTPDPPFTTGVQWAVAPDGRVALVDPSDYHVEYVTPEGRRTVGKPIPYTRVALSDGHKKLWRDQSQPACMTGRSGEFMVDGRAVRFTMVQPPEPTSWPEHMPPFLGNAATFASDGMLWVLRTGPIDAPPTYDIIDATGRLAHRVVLPRRAKLLGFGKEHVYIVRLDADDLQYLQRHRLPTTGGRR